VGVRQVVVKGGVSGDLSNGLLERTDRVVGPAGG